MERVSVYEVACCLLEHRWWQSRMYRPVLLPTCACTHTHSHTHTEYSHMHGCICEYCSHTYTPTHRCWSAKLRAHSMAQEVTADRQIGHLRRCHKGVLQRSGVKNPTYSFFCNQDVLFFLTVNAKHRDTSIKGRLRFTETFKAKQDN